MRGYWRERVARRIGCSWLKKTKLYLGKLHRLYAGLARHGVLDKGPIIIALVGVGNSVIPGTAHAHLVHRAVKRAGGANAIWQSRLALNQRHYRRAGAQKVEADCKDEYTQQEHRVIEWNGVSPICPAHLLSSPSLPPLKAINKRGRSVNRLFGFL
jgi:hypothetical protein